MIVKRDRNPVERRRCVVETRRAEGAKIGETNTAGLTSTGLLELVTSSLDDDQADNIVTIDLRKKTILADFMVIATGRSQRHVGAVAEHLIEHLKESKNRPIGVEGMPRCDWGADRRRRRDRPRIPAGGPRILQPRKNVVCRTAGTGTSGQLERFHFEWTRSSIMSLTAADRMVRACAGAPDNRRTALRP